MCNAIMSSQTNLFWMPPQLCSLLDATFIDHPRLADPQIIESLFIFCVTWSIGATLIQQPEMPVRNSII